MWSSVSRTESLSSSRDAQIFPDISSPSEPVSLTPETDTKALYVNHTPDSFGGGTLLDSSAFPTLQQQKLDEMEKENTLRPVILTPGETGTCRRRESLLSPPSDNSNHWVSPLSSWQALFTRKKSNTSSLMLRRRGLERWRKVE
jgi:hypothetical protein